MSNVSGMKRISEFFGTQQTDMYDVRGGRQILIPLEENRIYIIPGYQREIRWSAENVQILIDDLNKGRKFLGTITLSTSEARKYEVIDGQQRITVITLLITYLNSIVPEQKRISEICTIENTSFNKFSDALLYGFDYSRIESENKNLYSDIMKTDVLEQKDNFQIIWRSIDERVQALSDNEQENLFTALKESELNVIINRLDGTESQRKFCIDYFIDINNKSVALDSIDMIRAYAFKEDFESMTALWIDIQKKCNKLQGIVKYTAKELYFQYFICKVNEELEYKLTKSLGEKYSIKEDLEINGQKYSSGTFVWNMFSNNRFYAKMLNDLNCYLDFISLIIEHENGGNDEFKRLFYVDEDRKVDQTRILNTHTIINSILRNDDIVPKMMIMKYYLEVLKPRTSKEKMYKLIHDINAIAIIFTTMEKKKESEQIANKLLQRKWDTSIKEYAYKMLKTLPESIDFAKVALINRSYTVESGQYLARRYFSLYDAYKWSSGNISVNENIFKNSSITSGANNIEHFIINRNFEYALYLDDGNTVDIQIPIPAKFKKNIATIANYIILNSDVNSMLRNRPVYEKIELLEEEILRKGIDHVIPNKRSQLHYYLIKEIFHDSSKYPKKNIVAAKNKTERKKFLKAYYQTYFEKEFTRLTQLLKNEEKMFILEMECELVKLGFVRGNDILTLESDSCFANIEAKIDEKNKKLELSAELYNPYYGENKNSDELYSSMIDTVSDKFTQIFGKGPCISSSDEYGGSDDVSFTFSYIFEPKILKVEEFILSLNKISDFL